MRGARGGGAGGGGDLTMDWGSMVPAHSESSGRPILGFRYGQEEHTSNKWFPGAVVEGPEAIMRQCALPVKGVVPPTETCSVCLDNFTTPDCVRMSKCPTDHFFHADCILSAIRMNSRCPNCLTIYGSVQGTQPAGTMTVQLADSTLPGFKTRGVFVIHYSFPSGRQDSRHPHPGQAYHGTAREAYLPADAAGQKVLRLLMRAWDARVIFTVGTSVTTGRENSVVWNGIHHKTSLGGGPTSFGYPDPTYLTRVEQEMAAAGVFE